MTRSDGTRTHRPLLAAALVAITLPVLAGCGVTSGDANPDNQVSQAPIPSGASPTVDVQNGPSDPATPTR